jgi:DNA repair exonuclease SbcCD ATPase subunit
MVTKEDINKLAATLSEITKTLHNATTLANGAVEETGKLQEKISALSQEKEKLLAEIEELQEEKAQLIDFLQKTKESLDVKRKEILRELEEELFKKIDSLKPAADDKITLNSGRGQETTTKTPAKKEFPATDKKTIKKPANAPAIVDQFEAQASINDTITKSDPAITIRQPIHDIAKAIAINDRFLFIRELFDGNAALFSQTVNKLNTVNNLEDAKKYIQTVVKNWDDTSEPAQLFLSIVQRRYL